MRPGLRVRASWRDPCGDGEADPAAARSENEPRNLLSSLPRLQARIAAVPTAIHGERTQGGAGLPPKLPAAPTAPVVPIRKEKRTGANVIQRRAADDPPTKEIDLDRLQQDIATSKSDDQKTRRVSREAVAEAPPGADEYQPDPDEDFTDADPLGTASAAQGNAEDRRRTRRASCDATVADADRRAAGRAQAERAHGSGGDSARHGEAATCTDRTAVRAGDGAAAAGWPLDGRKQLAATADGARDARDGPTGRRRFRASSNRAHRRRQRVRRRRAPAAPVADTKTLPIARIATPAVGTPRTTPDKGVPKTNGSSASSSSTLSARSVATAPDSTSPPVDRVVASISESIPTTTSSPTSTPSASSSTATQAPATTSSSTAVPSPPSPIRTVTLAELANAAAAESAEPIDATNDLEPDEVPRARRLRPLHLLHRRSADRAPRRRPPFPPRALASRLRRRYRRWRSPRSSCRSPRRERRRTICRAARSRIPSRKALGYRPQAVRARVRRRPWLSGRGLRAAEVHEEW